MSPSSDRRFPAHEWPRLLAPRRRELAEPEHYLQAAEWPSEARLVDLGCGPGFFTPALLASLGSTGHLTAVDAHQAMLDVLQARHPAELRHPAVQAELDALPLPSSSLDVAWCAFVLHEVEPLLEALREVHRVLAPAGRLIVLEWDPTPTDHGPPAEDRISADVLAQAMVAAGFGVEGPRPVTDSQYRLDGLRARP